MKNLHIALIITCLLLVFWACSSEPDAPPAEEIELSFPEVEQTAKPWTRWWWQGSSVTKEGITAELEAYQKAGIGGLELTPIYGVKGEEANFVDYLSEEWMELFLYTLEEAKRVGLGVDMATGTGWPFGGPWIDADMACKNVQHKKYNLKGGEQLAEIVEFVQQPILRTVNSPNLELSDLIEPIAANDSLQLLALDQVRFEKKLPLQALVAYDENGQVLDLTEKVDEEGKLDWTAPDGNWELYAVFQGWHGKMVERAAPGGEGNVIDHFAKAPIEHYLARFDSAFAGKNIGSLRAFFNDSYEVDDARGQADWTPELFAEFEKRRGYDLKGHLPALFGEDEEDKNLRVLSDYRETVSDLLLETFTTIWSSWAKENNAIIRNQAHGSPANILDLYAASDIPETEGTDIIKAKMASSAAHVSGKPLASAEAATWLGEHFTTNLADLKENVDRYLAAGINHVFFHGTCYSPPGEEWPGRLFYAAIHANPRNPLWHDYPALNTYISRTQAFLQSGKPDNDILLYFPAYDRFARESEEMLEHFHGDAAPRNGSSIVRTTAEWLQENGYGFDFISDKQILGIELKDSLLTRADLEYQVIVIPETTFMPLATLEKLTTLTKNGAKVVFQKFPKSVPGRFDLAGRQKTFTQTLSNLEGSNLIVEPDLSKALSTAGIEAENLVNLGLEFNRRTIADGKIYFLSNWSALDVDRWINLAGSPKAVAIFDPMTGQMGFAETRNEGEQMEFHLQINQGGAVILRTFDANVTGQNWPYLNKKEEEIALDGPWKLRFTEGGPTLPSEQNLGKAGYWTILAGDAFQSFSGTAIYSCDFEKPDGEGTGWLLDLGEVAESAAVTLNGKEVGTLIGPVYQVYLPNNLLSEQNKLEIAVSNSMTNRIIALEKSGLVWKKFYNINFPARLRENLGPDRLFTTASWSPKPSGLAGPVSLTLIETTSEN